jgi:hypothetical protein
MVVCMSGHDVRASASLRLVTQSYRHRVSKDSTEGYSLSPADLYVIGLRLRPQLGERLDPTRNHSRLGPHIVLLELDDEVGRIGQELRHLAGETMPGSRRVETSV